MCTPLFSGPIRPAADFDLRTEEVNRASGFTFILRKLCGGRDGQAIGRVVLPAPGGYRVQVGFEGFEGCRVYRAEVWERICRKRATADAHAGELVGAGCMNCGEAAEVGI